MIELLILAMLTVFVIGVARTVRELKNNKDVADYVRILTRENGRQLELIEQLSQENQELKLEVAALVDQLDDSGS
jgi:hypothetical protein